MADENRNQDNRNNINDKWWLWVIGALVLFAFLIGISGVYRNGPEKPLNNNMGNNMGNNNLGNTIMNNTLGTQQGNNEDSDLKSFVQQTVTKTVGDKTNADQDRLKDVSVSPNSDDRTNKDVVINLNSDDNFTNNMTKNSMLVDSKKILKELSTRDDIGRVVINQYAATNATNDQNNQDNTTANGKVFTIAFTGDKLDNVDWNNVTNDDLKRMADTYEVDNSLTNR